MHASIISICLILALATPAFAQAKKAKKPMATNKPVVSRLEPRGIERGVETKIRLTGNNLAGLNELKLHHTNLFGELVTGKENANEAWIKVKAASSLKRGTYEISVANDKGESDRVKLFVDDVPQFFEPEAEKSKSSFTVKLPMSFWGTLNEPADTDQLEFEARDGQHLVFDASGLSIGSKANVNLSLFDAAGTQLAINNSFDGGDPLLIYTVRKSGRYRVLISEEQMGGSIGHFYRLSIGETPIVIGCFPLSVQTNAQAQVQLVGYNLPPVASATFVAHNVGEMEVPVDANQFRVRKVPKVLITDSPESVEAEPNNELSQATKIQIPTVVGGRIRAETKAAATARTKASTVSHGDVDLFHFEAKAGQAWVLETDAQRRGSPIDTRIEVLLLDGQPVERVLLQAVRNSEVTFRQVDSLTGDIRVENWEEMELNELMYLEGEVCKIFRMPEGPDSGFQFYRNGARRICYFDTSATARPVNSLCYIVEPHPPGTKLVANGLPVFTIDYANDDDGERELGADSRLHFTAPNDGGYLVRVTDTRGYSGEQFSYRLIIRPAAPSFNVTLNNPNPTVSPGSGVAFPVTVDRIDGFDGAITVEVAGLPPGFSLSAPLVIQAGHLQANATLCAAADVQQPSAELMSKVKITARATINGQSVVKDVGGFGKITVGEKPKLLVAIEPYNESDTNFNVRAVTDQPLEITVTPGGVVPAWLKIKREGHMELVTFSVDNLPHGVIVDNIGLSGVLIPKGENERQIYLRCAKWVPDTDRLAYCQARQAGNPTSLPVLIKVRRNGQQTAAK